MPLKDALLLIGLVMVGVGCWLISPAVALIVVGTLFMAAAVAIHVMQPRDK